MTATTTEKPPGLSLEFLPFVDMTTLTQSELRSLSAFSSSSVNPHRNEDIVTPIIDRSNFNESIGSRRQTYSRPSFHHHHHHHHRHRLAGLTPKTTNPLQPNLPTSYNPLTDPDRLESHSIISFLKQFLSSHPEFQQLDLVDFNSFSHLNTAINFTSQGQERKRKRGRKPKVKNFGAEDGESVGFSHSIGLEIVNKNGVAVNLVSLASLEDPYREELSRRTLGMSKEEELLGFFRELGGQWCSRRRKRKIVDASEFGSTLPIGWKLLLGLKRKEGRAWVYCRRYISPGGQQFVSCKEVSSYLQSFFGSYGEQHVRDYQGATSKEGDQRHSSGQEKAVSLVGFENLELAEVQIRDLFECHKCNMTFDERDSYLQHLLSFHQKTTRKYRLGSSVGDGVIVKDGKYECQFCHKVFHERRRYNGHVGIHVRNYVRGVEKSALQKRSECPTKDDLPTRTSKMDALIEIAQSSIQETSSGLNGETGGRFNEHNVGPNHELLASVSHHELKSDSSLGEPCIEYGMFVNSQELELHQQKVDCMIIDETTQKVDDSDDVIDGKIDSSGNEQNGEIGKIVIEHEFLTPLSTKKSCSTEVGINLGLLEKQDDCKSKVNRAGSVEIEVGFASSYSVTDYNILKETVQQTLKEDGLHHGSPELPVAPFQQSETFSEPSVSLVKGENISSVTELRSESIIGFEELRLEEIEQLKFSFDSGPEVPINVVNNSDMEEVNGASFLFESDEQKLTTLCIWCGVEFSYESTSAEMRSDSVGYMCPNCTSRQGSLGSKIC